MTTDNYGFVITVCVFYLLCIKRIVTFFFSFGLHFFLLPVFLSASLEDYCPSFNKGI